MATVPLPDPAVAEKKLAAFDSIPLFMKSLPEDGTENTPLTALQSLVYDGSPDGKQTISM